MRAGLSQESLAGKAEVHRNYFGRVERGEASITIETLLRIARVLKVPLRVVGNCSSPHRRTGSSADSGRPLAQETLYS